MANVFNTKIKIYGNKNIRAILRKINDRFSKVEDVESAIEIFYGSMDFAKQNYSLDSVQSITSGNQGQYIEIETEEQLPFNFMNHLTACLFQVDENVVVIGKSYVNNVSKGAVICRASWYDPDLASDLSFFEESFSSDLWMPHQKSKFFCINFSCGFVGKEGVEFFSYPESYMMESIGVYKRLDFYDLDQSKSDAYPLDFDFGLEFNFDISMSFTHSDFIATVKEFTEANRLFRIVLTQNNYPFFKELCDSEDKAYFLVSCAHLPYCDELYLEYAVDKGSFKNLLKGGLQIHDGKNFITYGDVAENTWFFNYEKSGYLKVDYRTHGKPINLFSGKLSQVAASIIDS